METVSERVIFDSDVLLRGIFVRAAKKGLTWSEAMDVIFREHGRVQLFLNRRWELFSEEISSMPFAEAAPLRPIIVLTDHILEVSFPRGFQCSFDFLPLTRADVAAEYSKAARTQ